MAVMMALFYGKALTKNAPGVMAIFSDPKM